MINLKELWAICFNEAIGEEQEKYDINPFDWRAGGRATKQYPNKEDGDWWNENGYKMLEDFVDVWENLGWKVWHTPEGIPGLELGINVYYGDTLVKAFIDMVAITPDDEIVVVDFKTGKNMPGNMQLGLYASSIEKQFGIRPKHGYYYDARKAMMTVTEDLDRWTPELFAELFRQFEIAVANEIFLPNVGMGCVSCSVADYCYANGGTKANTDPLFQIAKGKGRSAKKSTVKEKAN